MRRLGGLPVLFLVLAVPSFACFPRAPGPRLAHFETEAPEAGSTLPSVEVVDLEGARVDLRELTGERPLVVQVGSASCPVFRYRRFGMRRLVQEFGDRVSFVILYTREAHPVGSPSPYTGEVWDPWINRVTGARWTDTETTGERRDQAERAQEGLVLAPRVLVDPGGDPAWRDLGRAPSAAFVVDTEGRIVARQVWVDPPAIRETLLRILASGSDSPP